MNRHIFIYVAPPTHGTQEWTGGKTHTCVQTHARVWRVNSQSTNTPSGVICGVSFVLFYCKKIGRHSDFYDQPTKTLL